mgnify:CR=1 FL=1
MSIIRTLAIVLFFLTVWTTGLQAQYPYPDRPLHVHITGALLPLDQEKREDIVTVNVSIKEQPRLLRIGKIEQITQLSKTCSSSKCACAELTNALTHSVVKKSLANLLRSKAAWIHRNDVSSSPRWKRYHRETPLPKQIRVQL